MHKSIRQLYHNLGTYFASSKSTEKPTKNTDARRSKEVGTSVGSIEKGKYFASPEILTKSSEEEETSVESVEKFDEPSINFYLQATDSDVCGFKAAGPGNIIYFIILLNHKI